MSLSAEGVQGVKSLLDAVVSEGPTGTPGLVFCAVSILRSRPDTEDQNLMLIRLSGR
jgi:hypothetical protein